MKWDLNGVPGGTTNYLIYYIKGGNKDKILSYISDTNTTDRVMDISTNNNPFENRISGNLNLTNGNRTLTVTLSDVQYVESGLYNLDIQTFPGSIRENVDSILDVQGKKTIL